VRVLVLEDSPPTREFLKSALEEAGDAVTFAARASTARALAGADSFDVIVLDIMLPDGDGIDLCREIRDLGVTTPILFLSARGEVHDRVAGLDAGGDDFLRKPFAVAELRARLRALGRRGGMAPPSTLALGGNRIDFTSRRLVRGEREIALTAREWEVLELLAARAGRVVSRADILDLVWHERGDGASESLDVIVSRLRRKLSENPGPGRIRTVRGEGYVLEPGR
jgi:two-component system OmpR family response regulator